MSLIVAIHLQFSGCSSIVLLVAPVEPDSNFWSFIEDSGSGMPRVLKVNLSSDLMDDAEFWKLGNGKLCSNAYANHRLSSISSVIHRCFSWHSSSRRSNQVS